MIRFDSTTVEQCCTELYKITDPQVIIDAFKQITSDVYDPIMFPKMIELEENLQIGKVSRNLIESACMENSEYFRNNLEEELEKKKEFLDFLEKIIFNNDLAENDTVFEERNQRLREKMRNIFDTNSNIELDDEFGFLVCCSTETSGFSLRFNIPMDILSFYLEGVEFFEKQQYRSAFLICATALEGALRYIFQLRNPDLKFYKIERPTGNVIGDDWEISFYDLVYWASKKLPKTNENYLSAFDKMRKRRNKIAHLDILNEAKLREISPLEVKQSFEEDILIIRNYLNNVYLGIELHQSLEVAAK